MRIAILTDIHANREAFAAVLADVENRKVDQIVLLGDIVGYGPDPEWCCTRAMALVQAGALAVQGNHDAAVLKPDTAMNITARRAMDWTRPRLSPEQAGFLAGLPLRQRHEDLLFVHASAHDPQDWIYVSSAQRAMPSFRVCPERVIFCGHVHVPALISCDMGGGVQAQRFPFAMPVPLIRSRRWLAVVGAVGQPRDGRPLAAYALMDTTSNELTFFRIPYDTAATVAKLRAEGLPESLAMRLLSGA
ncbi:metallophosphoesterase family protein [Gemmobacter fulvus]|uniref:metallophosphoesterase family protein n=1 Tax=Gemmobacter fulvus TaxID=2840474 RepID=UPI002796C5B6|nr:metallophosphoesterase family protein [Gemmobacter fulvus]MDQ1848010.1 metallophosphoesterase family protein [Gemmobacter fulvus]